jgi:hypothetical protein
MAFWLPTKELLDLRALVLHRHQWVRIRTRIQNALQAIALANGLRRGPGLWSYDAPWIAREFEYLIMVRQDRRDVWWATPK